jgi:hypothetical protein
MSNLTDAPAFTANEIYEMQQTDGCEGAGSGASFGGLGINNQPHQQLANRTSYLKQRQDTNIGNINSLLAFIGLFTSIINPGGESVFKFPFNDEELGEIELIVLVGFWSNPNDRISGDQANAIAFSNPFPNAILAPPMLTNLYRSTGGASVVASVLTGSWTKNGFTLEFDTQAGASNERSDGVSYIAFGY